MSKKQSDKLASLIDRMYTANTDQLEAIFNYTLSVYLTQVGLRECETWLASQMPKMKNIRVGVIVTHARVFAFKADEYYLKEMLKMVSTELTDRLSEE